MPVGEGGHTEPSEAVATGIQGCSFASRGPIRCEPSVEVCRSEGTLDEKPSAHQAHAKGEQSRSFPVT